MRALLQIRNTPDPDCNISPAEILFGRQIRDAFSFVNRKNKYDNGSNTTHLERCLGNQRKVQCVFVSQDRQKPLMNIQDHYNHSISATRFLIQNQHGNNPNKWDKSGSIVEVGKHGQYTVKVDGAGRITLRKPQIP